MEGYYGPVPPIPRGPQPQLGQPRRPSQPSIAESVSNIMLKNAVYYPNYRVYRGETPASLNYNCISHVFYAFAHVSPDGGIFVSPLDGLRCHQLI
jgi:chitinase